MTCGKKKSHNLGIGKGFLEDTESTKHKRKSYCQTVSKLKTFSYQKTLRKGKNKQQTG